MKSESVAEGVPVQGWLAFVYILSLIQGEFKIVQSKPLWMNFGDRSFLKKYHELVHLNKKNGYNHLVYGLDDGFYTPF